MRRVVVDASVAVKWYFRERDSDAALRLLAAQNLDLLGPDILIPEVANALLRREREGSLDAITTDEALHDLSRAVSTPMRSADLLATAIGVSRRLLHPLPDCTYLALADVTKAQLVTADEQLVHRARARETYDRERLILLSEFHSA